MPQLQIVAVYRLAGFELFTLGLGQKGLQRLLGRNEKERWGISSLSLSLCSYPAPLFDVRGAGRTGQ